MLDMSRIESGKLHLEEVEVNLSDVLHDLKTIVSGQIYAKQLEFYMDAMDVTDEDVYCDKIRLNQIPLNLPSNAIKFTPRAARSSVRYAACRAGCAAVGSTRVPHQGQRHRYEPGVRAKNL